MTRPVIFQDEADAVFGKKSRDKDDLRGLYNAGHRRGAKAWRCAGDSHEVRSFDVFGAKAFAAIRDLPDTILDRAIPIRLKRRSRNEPIERGRYRVIKAAAEPLRERAEAWAEANLDALRDATPELPDELDDRAQDGAEPLLAIADHLGGDWPKLAREALVELHGGRTVEEDDWGVQLLADARQVFGRDDRLSTEEFLDRLKAQGESPWAGWNDGKGLNARGLAKLLRPYEIKSRTIRILSDDDESGTSKGYRAEDLRDAWSRYLSPPEGASKKTQPTHGLNKP